jgi:hypothetical protein
MGSGMAHMVLTMQIPCVSRANTVRILPWILHPTVAVNRCRSQAELVLQFRDPSMEVLDKLEMAMLAALEEVKTQEGRDGTVHTLLISHGSRTEHTRSNFT